ncbi:hypothetical protein CEQ90_00560 [Lewinellaceae bacterium SD302]|nr:hypothetical protein CEQ90_00560 [Lewinellaceae bacterium SD302]
MRLTTFIFLLCFINFPVSAQDMAEYNGSWRGVVERSDALSFTVAIDLVDDREGTITVSNYRMEVKQKFDYSSAHEIKIPLADDVYFIGYLADDAASIHGFIQSGILFYNLKLDKSTSGLYTGKWHIFMFKKLEPNTVFLSVEGGAGDDYQLYPFFGDDRFTGTWCNGFEKENDELSFFDFKTGMRMKGRLLEEQILLQFILLDEVVTEISFSKTDPDWQIKTTHDSSEDVFNNKLQLSELEDSIAAGGLANTHAVLISRNGQTIYERYFNGYLADIPHDQRSASKSVSSAMIGIAIDQGIIPSVTTSVLDYLPSEYSSGADSLKRSIDFHSLLTMSSGLDANDNSRDRVSAASENNYQQSPNWLKTVLSAEMVSPPNQHANYGSANPYLLGRALDSILDEPTVLFMHRNLFEPLGVSNYIVQTDETGRPYFGGGMYLTPAQMLRFGELYLNEGTFNGKRILTKDWVKASFTRHTNLENVADQNGYGYLWWQHNYTNGGKTYQSYEARGAGGQYIFVIPELSVVVAITSGNFRNGNTRQPEGILEQYVLPSLE